MNNIILKIKKFKIGDSDEMSLSSVINHIIELIDVKIKSITETIIDLKNKIYEIDKLTNDLKITKRQVIDLVTALEEKSNDNNKKIIELTELFSKSQELTGFIHMSSIANYSNIELIIDKPDIIYYNLEISKFKKSYKDNDGKIKFKTM